MTSASRGGVGATRAATATYHVQQDISIVLLQGQGITAGLQCSGQEIDQISRKLVQELGVLRELILHSRSVVRSAQCTDLRLVSQLPLTYCMPDQTSPGTS